jgi:hypothetical protein
LCVPDEDYSRNVSCSLITEALELVGGLDYPKSKINLFIYVDVSSTFIAHY